MSIKLWVSGYFIFKIIKLIFNDCLPFQFKKARSSIQRMELDADLINNFTLHLHHFERDTTVSTNIFSINYAMIFGVRKETDLEES